MIMTFATLKYGRNKNNVGLRLYWSRNNKSFTGIFSFIMGVPPSNFVVVSFLLTPLQKDYFLRQRLQCYRFLIAEIAVSLVLDIGLRASSRIAMRNRFVYDGWIRLQQYYTDVSLPKRHPTENVSFTSKALVSDNKSMLYSMVIRNLTFFQRFATSRCVKETLAVTQMICHVVHAA